MSGHAVWIMKKLTLALVVSLAEEGNHRVSGVRDDSADDTSNVTRSEGDCEAVSCQRHGSASDSE